MAIAKPPENRNERSKIKKTGTHSLPIMPFPIIDLTSVDDPSSLTTIASQITSASSEWGFLLLKNHPIPIPTIQRMFSLAHDFFLNVPDPQKLLWPINDKYVGYSSALSDRKKDDKASMWLSGKPGFLQSPEGRDALPPYWHDKLEQIEAFKHACHSLLIKLLQCFALAMDLQDRDHFARAHAEDAGNGNQFRLLHYPSRAHTPTATTTRMSPHSDSGSVTLLFQTCAGLEIESPSGEWVPAPCIENHILVNLGDALAFWSGGRLKATKHRVTFAGVPHDVERISMAYFGAAAPETVLRPIQPEGAAEMERYEANGLVVPAGITVGEYSKMIMESIYGTGVAKREERREEVGRGHALRELCA